MKGGLEMKVQGLKTSKAAPAAECKEVGNQKGSLLLEAIVVLGMIATFTPMLYKHVADRRADIENINRANTLLYLQHKAEDYLKDPDNITALVEELGHNQHKEIYPSEMGAGDNFDGRYIVGIRREDENNKPVLKAMIIDTVHTGSDLRAAKVAELIGVSAGIYTAVDPDAAWGINGIWSEPLSRYFDTTNIPTGAVAITTEYNKAKYRVNISDILVDADLDMGEFEVTAEQINAVAIAAQNGTLDQLIAQDVRASNKVVAGKKLCVGGEEDENCIESWEGLGGKDDSDLRLVQECNAGMTESCMGAFARDLNTSCSKVDEVYDRFGAAYPSPKIYNLTYGSGTQYTGTIRTKCEGTQFVVSDISTSTLTNPVEQVGDTAFGITTPGWYQITLMGEAGWWVSGGYTWAAAGAGGILITNTYYDVDTLLTLKGIKGSPWEDRKGGAGIALWDEIVTTGAPKLAAGGGGAGPAVGGGYNGGARANYTGSTAGYSWDGTTGTNTTYCSSTACNVGAVGGRWWYASGNWGGHGGTGYCGSGYTCTTIAGGNASGDGSSYFASAGYGNWGDNTLTGGAGYVSIVYCGTSESDCPTICTSDSDCGYHEACDLSTARCAFTPYTPGEEVFGITNIGTMACYTYDTTTHSCTNNDKATGFTGAKQLETYTILADGKYKITVKGEAGWVMENYGSPCPSGTGGYTCNYYSAAGGTNVVEKVLTKNTVLKFIAVAGGVSALNGSVAQAWGGSGVGLLLDGSIFMVAGGGCADGYCGGGYLGGQGHSAIGNGYSWDGTQTNFNTTYASGASGGASSGSTWSCQKTHGGSGYCADTTCVSTYGTASTMASCWTTNSNGLPKGPGYATVVYCGPNADSTCP